MLTTLKIMLAAPGTLADLRTWTLREVISDRLESGRSWKRVTRSWLATDYLYYGDHDHSPTQSLRGRFYRLHPYMAGWL